MAENSVHATQTLDSKPTIFELVAADSLQSTFEPALKRVAHYLANVNPTKFGWIYRYYDEIYLCLNGAIQQHYLRTYGGSLAEIFYSLTRSRVSIDRFTKRDRFISFVCIVLLPYVRSKIANMIQRWQDERENGTTTAVDPVTAKQRAFAINAYRSWSTITDCLQLVQFIMYLANLSKSHSIANRVIGVQLKYMPPEMNMRWTWSDLFSGNFRNPAIFTGLLFRSLELSAFFLQFVQWWQNESTHGSLTKLPSPEAPAPNAGESRYGNLCPICLQTWKIPTANRISGYVFCYRCIVKHLQSKNSCPVTNYPSTIDDLIRIYDV